MHIHSLTLHHMRIYWSGRNIMHHLLVETCGITTELASGLVLLITCNNPLKHQHKTLLWFLNYASIYYTYWCKWICQTLRSLKCYVLIQTIRATIKLTPHNICLICKLSRSASNLVFFHVLRAFEKTSSRAPAIAIGQGVETLTGTCMDAIAHLTTVPRITVGECAREAALVRRLVTLVDAFHILLRLLSQGDKVRFG